MRLIDYFDRGVRHFPERACLVDGELSKSYREVSAATYRIAGRLLGSGLKPGERVAVLSPNSAAAFECVLGLLRANAVWVPLNARNVMSDHIHFLGLTGSVVLFYHSQFAGQIDQIRAEVPSLRTVICIDKAEGPGTALEDWLQGPAAPVPEGEGGPEDLATLLSTGGTTGKPKAARLTNLCWSTMIANFCAEIHYASPPTHLVIAPMTHAAGVITFPLMAQGATNIILAKVTPGEILAAIERHQVTTLFLPPTLIYMLLAHPELRKYDYRSLQHFIYAAAPMSVEKLRQAIEVFGPVMLQTFGQAEAPMVCTLFSREAHVEALRGGNTERLASCGRAGLLTRVAIMDDDGRLLPPGERGEIVVRDTLVMDGYHENPAATAEVSRFGWHHTGDIGYADKEGYYYIVDRKRDMIISGGFNIYPSEIEQVLWTHPAVQDCAVIGVPDEKWGEAVKAIVELKPGMKAEPEELAAHCKNALGGVRAPKTVEIWQALPRSAVGKVLKREIRARFWEGHARKI
jgi:acyl-CoA synthetase (AMP-forming)/AMP-acid ligase II